MSSKKARRELLRVLVLAALLSTPYMGVGAVEYPITGDTIGGTHELQGQHSLFDFTVDQEVTATSDVSVISEVADGEEMKVVFDGSLKEDLAK